ncbi:MAG: hypothetical protein JWQ94_552 [Tardiphaga sp.]|nr:hypothetical protein [Tardiphaga sp.]
MSQAYPSTVQIAKSGPGNNCYGISKTATFPTIHRAVTDFFERLQPKKTWALIAETLHLKEHTAKHRAANHTVYSVEELQVLLHGANGREVLDLLMASASPIPEWWTEWCKTWELTAIRGEQAQLQQRALALDNTPMDRPARRKLKRFIDADRHLSATRAEKETAVGLLAANAGRGRAGAMDAAAAQAQAASNGRAAGGRGR